MPDREKVMYSLERCSSSVPDACRDCEYDKWPARICVQHLTTDALELLTAQEEIHTKQPAQMVPMELLAHTWGHGWLEMYGYDYNECVWINGKVLTDNGQLVQYLEKTYGKVYGWRIWTGDKKPTKEQMEETPWAE